LLGQFEGGVGGEEKAVELHPVFEQAACFSRVKLVQPRTSEAWGAAI
jgi:hypothetical protein